MTRAVQCEIQDAAICPQLVRAAVADWPDACWSGWHCYADGKLASRALIDVPESIRYLLHLIAERAPVFHHEAFPDLSYYGAGLHELPPDTGLGWHRDAQKHPRKPWQRLATAILYLDHGGRLLFRGASFEVAVDPAPGRLFTFNHDDAFDHCVEKSDERRRSLTVFFYRADPDFKGRTCADFAKTEPKCKHCGAATKFKQLTDVSRFYHCDQCGCDSSDHRYADVADIYDESYIHHHNLSYEGLLAEVGTNIDMITSVAVTEKTALDVGCLDGATICRLHRLGWDVHGWDVNPSIPSFVEEQSGIPADRIEIGTEFKANGRQYGCVISREVIEHVDDHKSHFAELVKAALPGGIVHLQTPQPHDNPDDGVIYQAGHLCILSPRAIEELFAAHGMTIEQRLDWGRGHAWIGRKPA